MTHQFYTTCAYFTAARYLRTVERVTNHIFAPTGMKPAYSYIMMALQDQSPATIMELAAELGYERSTVSRMIKTLSQQNLVVLASQGRATTVTLTATSTEFLQTANDCLDELGRVTDKQLGADKPAMTSLLTKNQLKMEAVLK